MNEQERRDAALQDLWLALSRVWPPDRVSVGFVFLVFTGVALYSGLGLVAPIYGAVLTALFVGLVYVLALNGKSRLP